MEDTWFRLAIKKLNWRRQMASESGRRCNTSKVDNVSRSSVCSRRHRSTSSSSRSGTKESKDHPSHAFTLKCAKEQEKLRQLVYRRLQQELIKLLEDETFADVVIECDSFAKRCHSCILINRVPTLYKELFDNFRTSERSCSELTLQIPFHLERSRLLVFLRKIYSEDDIRKDEIDLVRQLRQWIMENSNPDTANLIEFDLEKSEEADDGNENLSDNAETFNVSDEEAGEVKPVVYREFTSKSADSLNVGKSLTNLSSSAINSDSLTNVSLSNDEKGLDEESSRESNSVVTDDRSSDSCDDEDDDDGDEDNERGQEAYCSSSSSQMVRSGTFDLLCQMPLEDALDKASTEENAAETPEKPTTLELKRDNSENCEEAKVSNLISEQSRKSVNRPFSGNLDEDSSNDLDAETPVAEPASSFPPPSPGSLFQYFIDVDSVQLDKKPEPQSSKNGRSASSSFMFIDIGTQENKNLKRVQGENIRGMRSNSASVIDAKPKNVSSDTLTRNIPNGQHKSCQDLIDNQKSSSSSSSVVRNVHEEEIPLLPMSPILRRKRTQEKQPVELKAKSSLDLKHIESTRMQQSFDSSDLMSCSWKSEGGRSDLNSNSPTKRLTTCRQYSCSPSIRDDESVYSEVSSISSSMAKDRPIARTDSIDEQDSLLNRTLESCSKLGEDLLRMFFNEINADVIIQAEDKEIRAHKCILVSRSPYFLAMFTGEWVESQAHKINLKGFSYNSVHFALCHIYSGAVVIPRDNLNLGELALLSDLLSLDTLKEVVLFELKKNFCHFFHKPCHDCIHGVLDCLVLSGQCGLDNLHIRCLSWIGKHFQQIWPTKAFATLQPMSLIQAAYQSTINQMTPDNIIEVILHCERLATTVPRVKWAEVIFSLLAKLMEDCCNYVASNYDLVVATSSFVSLGKGRSWNISTLEGTLLAAMNALTPDVACKTIIQLGNILVISDTETAFGYGPYTDTYVALVKKMYRHCERYLIHNAGAVAHCQSWNLLSIDLQQHVRDSAVIVFEFDKPIAPKPKLSSVNRKPVKSRKPEPENLPKPEFTRNAVKRTSKVLPKVRSQPSPLKAKNNYHIYDEVPAESSDTNSSQMNESNAKQNKLSNKSSHEEANNNNQRNNSSSNNTGGNNNNTNTNTGGVKKSQVAKVSPFTVKQTSSHADVRRGNPEGPSGSDSLNALVAEIDADSNLVNNCLQEAELLEQELTRKLQKQNTASSRLSQRPTRSVRSHARTNSQDLNAGRSGTTHVRPRPASGTGRPQRPPFK